MKLYHLLILSLFAFVSCENFSSEDEYIFSHKREIQHPEFEQLKVRIDAYLKITISDKDDCVYFIYECQRPMHDFKSPKSLAGEEYSEKESLFYNGITMTPERFLLILDDREGNNVGEFYSDKNFQHISVHNKNNYPVFYKGKLLEHYNGDVPISAKKMRSKLNRTEQGILKIGYHRPEGKFRNPTYD